MATVELRAHTGDVARLIYVVCDASMVLCHRCETPLPKDVFVEQKPPRRTRDANAYASKYYGRGNAIAKRNNSWAGRPAQIQTGLFFESMISDNDSLLYRLPPLGHVKPSPLAYTAYKLLLASAHSLVIQGKCHYCVDHTPSLAGSARTAVVPHGNDNYSATITSGAPSSTTNAALSLVTLPIQFHLIHPASNSVIHRLGSNINARTYSCHISPSQQSSIQCSSVTVTRLEYLHA